MVSISDFNSYEELKRHINKAQYACNYFSTKYADSIKTLFDLGFCNTLEFNKSDKEEAYRKLEELRKIENDFLNFEITNGEALEIEYKAINRFGNDKLSCDYGIVNFSLPKDYVGKIDGICETDFKMSYNIIPESYSNVIAFVKNNVDYDTLLKKLRDIFEKKQCSRSHYIDSNFLNCIIFDFDIVYNENYLQRKNKINEFIQYIYEYRSDKSTALAIYINEALFSYYKEKLCKNKPKERVLKDNK